MSDIGRDDVENGSQTERLINEAKFLKIKEMLHSDYRQTITIMVEQLGLDMKMMKPI